MGLENFNSIVYAAVLIPNKPDYDGDVVSKEQIREKMYNFMRNYQNIDFMHSLNAVKSTILENYILPFDMEVETYGVKRTLPAGTWVMGIEIEDEAVKNLVREGKIRGFSVMGVKKSEFVNAMKDNREPAIKRTTFRDLGEDFEITHVSLVDTPAVSDALFFAFKSRTQEEKETWKDLFKAMFSRKGKEEIDLNKEELKELIEATVKSTVETALKEILSEKSADTEDKVEEKEQSTEQTTEDNKVEDKKENENTEVEKDTDEQKEDSEEETVENSNEEENVSSDEEDISSLKSLIEELKNEIKVLKSTRSEELDDSERGFAKKSKSVVTWSDLNKR